MLLLNTMSCVALASLSVLLLLPVRCGPGQSGGQPIGPDNTSGQESCPATDEVSPLAAGGFLVISKSAPGVVPSSSTGEGTG